jgi:hypothetical protein
MDFDDAFKKAHDMVAPLPPAWRNQAELSLKYVN